MSDYYLDFELPLKEIDQKILELESDPNSKNTSEEISSLSLQKKERLEDLKNSKNYTPYNKSNYLISDGIYYVYINIKYRKMFMFI